ncbi:MAG: phage head closure protein [Pseudomonadota bacterium]
MARAGAFRDYAVIERKTIGANDQHGQPETVWGQLATVWADVLETPGRERLQAGRLEAPATATIRVRASSITRALTASERLRVRGEVWNIRSVIQVGRKRDQVEILAERGVAVG